WSWGCPAVEHARDHCFLPGRPIAKLEWSAGRTWHAQIGFVHLVWPTRPIRRISMMIRALTAAFLIAAAPAAMAQTTWPNLQEGDSLLKDFRFASGETIAELKLHYRTLGTAERNAAGEIVNGVVLLHGTSGSGADWLRPSLANELFGAGQPLDAGK